ncbi:MAG: methylated-DNA--[protein]-cysteine S-methyltransferase [Bacteroidales bacterium]|nr:methylated-DNA--[protein]-cysteine S-methyltransferase [Bacteroidales bacterium]
MNRISIQYVKIPFGELIIGSFNNQLCICDWRYRKMRTEIDKRIQNGLNASYFEENSETIQLTIQQLNEYTNGEREIFNVPLNFIGTDFQKEVWNELLKIPFGETETYLGLSKKMNKEKAIRAVASANGANAISIIVPCHRIIGSNGKLVGYAGGLNVKNKLLQLESKNKQNKQLNLFND